MAQTHSRIMKKILVLNGPNLDILGERQPDIYGPATIGDVEDGLRQMAVQHEVHLDFFTTNYEGAAVEKLHEARGKTDFIIINPASFTPFGIAVRSALVAAEVPAILVHISNIYGRNDTPDRHRDVFAPIVVGQICGLGVYGYALAFRAALRYLGKGLKLIADPGL
jgi:3-dehydroquinate dehydratase-2